MVKTMVKLHRKLWNLIYCGKTKVQYQNIQKLSNSDQQKKTILYCNENYGNYLTMERNMVLNRER